MKAWFVMHKEGDYGEIVLADTRGKAILGSMEYDNDSGHDYINYRARRVPGADDLEHITPRAYLENGISFPCSWCEHDIQPNEPYTLGSNGHDLYCEDCNR